MVIAVVRQGSLTVTTKLIAGAQVPSECEMALLKLTVYVLCLALLDEETMIFCPLPVMGAPEGMVQVKTCVTVRPHKGV